MKNIIVCLLFSVVITNALYGQREEEKEKGKGFKKENLFTGGSVTASFFSGGTLLGVSPIFGYKLANWIDAGAVINFTYSGERDVKEVNDKIRQTIYGGGLFTRIYPVNFLFIQGQLEHNFTKQKYVPAPGSVSYSSYNATVDANSLLVGAGYTQGRGPGSNTFFYLSILFDVIKNQNSPYVDLVYSQTTGQYSVRAIPIIRGGINVGLFEGHDNRSRGRGRMRRY
jgi:hypothetical protein